MRTFVVASTRVVTASSVVMSSKQRSRQFLHSSTTSLTATQQATQKPLDSVSALELASAASGPDSESDAQLNRSCLIIDSECAAVHDV